MPNVAAVLKGEVKRRSSRVERIKRLTAGLCLGCVVGSVAEEPARLRVLFVGDSISGSTAEAYVGYAHHIESAMPDWQVTRISVNTSASLLSRLRRNRGRRLRGRRLASTTPMRREA